MKLFKLAQILDAKLQGVIDREEKLLRKDIDLLWDIPNKKYNIIKACAESNVSKAKNREENIAIAGFKFCKKVIDEIDFLKKNKEDLSFGEIRESLLVLTNLIKDNIHIRFNDKGKVDDGGESTGVQFGQVSELIFQMVPISTKHQIKLRNELYSKARTGFANIVSLANSMLEKLQDLEVKVPERFTYKPVEDIDINQKNVEEITPQRTQLSRYDIIDFIREYGDEYHIPNQETWEAIIKKDPSFKELMTTVINAKNRGHIARIDSSAKQQIKDMVQELQEEGKL